ncbi:MAG: outer membrane protein transport protein [Nitrospiraceae bacterium]|nr:MAG: outer membrane protein transport protein [Nitrospiraceae bacterium]
MKVFRSFVICLAALALLLGIVSVSYATNGYYANGYSVQNKGLAGAGTALPLDTIATAANPAGMVWIGSRADFALTLFNPNREYTITGNPSMMPGTFGLAPGTVKSDSKWFVIPSLGYNRMMNEDYSLGISLYGNGGMNTDYDTNTFFGTTPTGVDLAQLFVVPTYARKLNAKHSIGLSPIIAYQRFEAKGLQAFAGFSSDGTNLTNKDHDNSFGYGGRIGYLGEVYQGVFIGATYQTKIYMSEFDDYAGLFAEQGDFDIPANWSVGLSVEATPEITIALDVQQILYSDIKSINNPFLPNLQTALLGNDGGAGFGWEDTLIVKVGVQWQAAQEWIVRAGYSYGEQPIPDSEVMFNIIAPGVIKHHITAGCTKKIGKNQEVHLAVMHAFENDVSSANPLEVPGQQTIKLTMNQWEYTAGYSWKF